MKKEGLWVTFVVVAVLAMMLLPFAIGAGKVDPLLGAFRQNDVDSTSVPVQTVTPGDGVNVTTSATDRAIAVDSSVARRDASNTYTGGTNDATSTVMLVATPTADAHAATKGYVDEALPIHVWVSIVASGVVTGSTTLVTQGAGATEWSGLAYQNPGADGDARAFNFQCATGVYDVALGYSVANNRGRLDIRIGSTLVIDNLETYAAVANEARATALWTNSVTTEQTVYFIVDGKHASSSGYFMLWQFFDMRRQ